MRDLSAVPSLGFWERRKLKREGWQLVHQETVDFVANQHNTSPVSDVYPPSMKEAIASYGGQDKVKVLSYTHASAFMGPGDVAFRVTFYVLGKPENFVV